MRKVLSGYIVVIRKLPFFLTMLLTLIVPLCYSTGAQWPSWDESIYLQLAHSIRTGGAYSYLAVEHVKYPPLFPLCLVLISVVAGDSREVMHTGCLFFAMLAMLLSYFLAARVLQEVFEDRQSTWWYALFLPVLLCVDLVYCTAQGSILSEYLYTCFLLLFCYMLFTRSVSLWVSSLLAVSLCAVRLAGIGVVGGSALYAVWLWWRGEENVRVRKFLVPSLAGLAFCCLWLLRSLVLEPQFPFDTFDNVGYFPELVSARWYSVQIRELSVWGIVRRVLLNLERYSTLLLAIASNYTAHLLVAKCVAFTSAVLLFWGLRGAKVHFVLAILVGNAMLLLGWEAYQGARFLVPLIPLLYLLVLLGAARLGSNGRVRCVLSVVLLGSICAYKGSVSWAYMSNRKPDGSFWATDKGQLATWFRAQEQDDICFMSPQAPVIAYASGVSGFAPPASDRPLLDYLKTGTYTHVVVRPGWQWNERIAAVVEARGDLFRKVKEVGGAVVYEVASI